jgi:predicted RNase H-like nuclease (RuvC/YqgF family)
MDTSQNPSTHPNHDMARYSSPGRKPFALSPNKPMTLQMGMLIGQQDSAATEAEQLLNTVRRLREAKKNVITHMANLQKTCVSVSLLARYLESLTCLNQPLTTTSSVSTQSTQITELNSRLSDLRTHCDRLEIDNANLKRMTASPTLVASRKINGADQNIESATINPRREKGSLMALQRAKDMEKEMQNVANKVDKSPIVSVPVSGKVSPLFSMRSQSDFIEQVTDIDTFSLMLDEALETPPESRVVSRMASQAFSFNLEKQKLVGFLCCRKLPK